jgi:hypothetical protein
MTDVEKQLESPAHRTKLSWTTPQVEAINVVGATKSGGSATADGSGSNCQS